MRGKGVGELIELARLATWRAPFFSSEWSGDKPASLTVIKARTGVKTVQATCQRGLEPAFQC